MNWRPIEEFDKSAMHRIPVMVYDPKWYDRMYPKANIAMAYWDMFIGGGRFHITMFESASAYAWVTYNYAAYNPAFFAEILDFTLPS